VGLSQKGKQDAHKLGQYFTNKKITAIYSSPLLRTKQTAQIIGTKLHLVPKYSQHLLEVKSPVKKITHSELSKFGGFIYNHPQHKKSGETKTAVLARMQKFVNKMLNQHPGENIIIVSHGDPIMLMAYGTIHHRPYIPKGGVIPLIRFSRYSRSFSEVSSITSSNS